MRHARSLTPRGRESSLQPRREQSPCALSYAPLRTLPHGLSAWCAVVCHSASQQTAEAAAAVRAATRLQRRLNEEVAAKAAVETRLRQVEARVEEAVRAAAASTVQLTGATETWFAISNVRLSQRRAAPPLPRPSPRRTPWLQSPIHAHHPHDTLASLPRRACMLKR